MNVKAIHRCKCKPEPFREIDLFFHAVNVSVERPLACKLASALARHGWQTSVFQYTDSKLLELTVERRKKRLN